MIVVYHRERIWFSSTLSCNMEEEKITKPLTLSAGDHFNQPSNFELVSPFQSTKQLWAREPISINQATLSSWAHFNRPSNFELVSPFQSTKQLWAQALTSINQATLNNTWPGTCFFYLPQQLTPPSSPKPRTNGPTYPSTPFEHGILWCGLVASIWPSGDITDGQVDTFSSWIDWTVKKSASKSSAVSAQEEGILYWPAFWVAYKRKSGRLHSPVCSQWSTPPHPSHPSWTQPELHHLDTSNVKPTFFQDRLLSFSY